MTNPMHLETTKEKACKNNYTQISMKGYDKDKKHNVFMFLAPGAGVGAGREVCSGGRAAWCEYLSLDAVQPSEPEDLTSAQLHLGVVNLIHVLDLLLLLHLLLGAAVTNRRQELEPVCGDGGDELRRRRRREMSDQQIYFKTRI